MSGSIIITIGVPKHGWLPVDLSYGSFNLCFDASNILNDPINELCNAIIDLKINQPGEVTWWLEPAAYFFYVARKDSGYILEISFTDDYNFRNTTKRVTIQKIEGNYNQIIQPIVKALKQFCAHTYNENDWPFKISREKLAKL